MTKTKDRVSGVAGNAKPYVERALKDEELREHVKQAYVAAREIYDELVGPRGVTGIARVAGDQEVQENLKTAVAELRQAANRLQGRKEHHHGGRNLLLLAGVIAGLLYNPVTGPPLRRWVTNRLFGGDEFGYDSGGSSGNGSAG